MDQKNLILEVVDMSLTPVSMLVMSMISDAQEAIERGNKTLAHMILNNVKTVIDNRLSVKDAEGRHIKPNQGK